MKKITLLLFLVACTLFAQAQTNVANIAALKAANSTLAFGTTTTGTFTITGEVVVTFVSTSTAGVRTVYIQDASGAFMLYDSGKLITTSPALYCGLTGVTGTIKSYSGILEMILTAAPATPTSTGNTPFAPIVTTLDQLINYPLQVCKVYGVMVSDQTTGGTGLFVAAKNFPLSVGGLTSTTVLRTSYPDVNYIGASVPTTAVQNITGLVLPYQSSATTTAIVDFIPRSLSDFQVATGLSTPSIDQLSVKVIGGRLSVENASTTTVEIYNATGARAQFGTLENGSIQLNSLAKGLYVVRVGNATAKIML